MRSFLVTLNYLFQAIAIGALYCGAIGFVFGALIGQSVGGELAFAVWGATTGLKFGSIGGVVFGLLGAAIGGPAGWTFAGLIGGSTAFIFLSPGRNVTLIECIPVAALTIIGLVIGLYNGQGSPSLPVAHRLYRQGVHTSPLHRKKALRISLKLLGFVMGLSYFAFKISAYY